MRPILLLLAILAVAASASVAYRYLHEEWIVDNCLSGKHGSFDYSTMSCDTETNHDYIDYDVRHPYDIPVGLAAIVALTVLALTYGHMARGKRRLN